MKKSKKVKFCILSSPSSAEVLLPLASFYLECFSSVEDADDCEDGHDGDDHDGDGHDGDDLLDESSDEGHLD